MKWKVKAFKDLTVEELYEILRLRVDVFVVEQNCPYYELDGFDQQATHLLGYENGQLLAYSRLFRAGVVAEQASIGRVIVKKEARQHGYGQALLRESIHYLETEFHEEQILIHAQLYLKSFYESFGFKAITACYDLDGIDHLDMLKRKGELV